MMKLTTRNGGMFSCGCPPPVADIAAGLIGTVDAELV